MARQPETCYWCGGPGTSDEHVPPNNLFLPGTRQITVPSCRRHNEDFHLLDERFRVYLQGTSSSPLAAQLFGDKTLRSLNRGRGLMKSIADASSPARLDNEETIAIGVTAVQHDAYFEKIGRALYFRHYGDPFTGEVRFSCSHFHTEGINFKDLIAVYHQMKGALRPGEATDERVFTYEYGRGADSKGASFFLRMTFYGDITVFCLGAPAPSWWRRIWRWFRQSWRLVVSAVIRTKPRSAN